MGSSWIKDKVVSAVEADVKENGGDANEVIWQLSKELKKLVRVNGAGVRETQKIGHLDPEVLASIDAGCIGDATIKGRIRTGVVTLPAVDTTAFGAEDLAKMVKAKLVSGEFSPKLTDSTNYPNSAPFDVVERPAHYAEGREYEPKDVIRDWGLNFNVGSAVKYCSRLDRKDDDIEQLDKAITFLQFEREARLKERSNEPTES